MKDSKIMREISFIVGCLLALLVICAFSCITSQYGCKGNISWDKMVKKINKPY